MVVGKRGLYRFTKLLTLPFLTFEVSNKARYKKKDHLDLLINISLVNGFAESVSNTLGEIKKVPNGDTLLACLKNQDRGVLLEQFNKLTERNLRILKSNGVFNKPLPIAIDWHDIMYYGNPSDEMVVGTQHNKGSNYAFEFLTASVVLDKARLLLAIAPVDSRKSVMELTVAMIERIRRLGVKIAYLTFDRGFHLNKLIDYLERNRIRYILHLFKTTKMRNLRAGKRIKYQSSKLRGGSKFITCFDFVVAFDKDKQEKYILATNLPYDAGKILELFKVRWGVETNYRMCNQFLIKTTSKNYTIRLFYYLFACLIYNVWVVWNSKRDVHTTVIRMKIFLIMEITLGEKNIVYT